MLISRRIFVYAGELFISFVLSRRAHARIVSVDPKPALALKGVHDYIDHKDVPGLNKFGPEMPDEEVFATKEVGGS